MDNKNAAPERMELPKGYYLTNNTAAGDFHLKHPDGRLLMYQLNPNDNVLRDFAAAMQPVPSESDGRQGVPEVWPDDVLTGMDNAWRNATDVRRVGHYETLMAVGAAAIRGLARHRPPVAAPYGAEGLREALSTVYGELSEGRGVSGQTLRMIADALAQSPTIQAEGGWLPIDSAPRDGTWFLATGGSPDDEAEDRPIAVISWTTNLNGTPTRGFWAFARYDGGCYGSYNNPTHWQPLPLAPTNKPQEV